MKLHYSKNNKKQCDFKSEIHCFNTPLQVHRERTAYTLIFPFNDKKRTPNRPGQFRFLLGKLKLSF
jgi:hypothetical protein